MYKKTEPLAVVVSMPVGLEFMSFRLYSLDDDLLDK